MTWCVIISRNSQGIKQSTSFLKAASTLSASLLAFPHYPQSPQQFILVLLTSGNLSPELSFLQFRSWNWKLSCCVPLTWQTTGCHLKFSTFFFIWRLVIMFPFSAVFLTTDPRVLPYRSFTGLISLYQTDQNEVFQKQESSPQETKCLGTRRLSSVAHGTQMYMCPGSSWGRIKFLPGRWFIAVDENNVNNALIL